MNFNFNIDSSWRESQLFSHLYEHYYLIWVAKNVHVFESIILNCSTANDGTEDKENEEEEKNRSCKLSIYMRSEEDEVIICPGP